MIEEKKTEVKQLQTEHFHSELLLDHFNERLRVDDYRGNVPILVSELFQVATTHRFSKIIFYSRQENWQELLNHGFALEGIVKGFFNGSDGYVMVYYPEQDRRHSNYWKEEDEKLHALYEKGRSDKPSLKKAEGYHFRKATVEDAVELAALYDRVFEIYPTPMNEPSYLRKVMEEGTIFQVAEYEGKIVSAASADMNERFHHAEMTDCATVPEHRKAGLIKHLLTSLEAELRENGIYCAFSLARALSFGMNAAFYQLGYDYGGRLTNNCYIFDKMEDMNIWTKDLSCIKG